MNVTVEITLITIDTQLKVLHAIWSALQKIIQLKNVVVKLQLISFQLHALV